jgi:hypothetical protein
MSARRRCEAAVSRLRRSKLGVDLSAASGEGARASTGEAEGVEGAKGALWPVQSMAGGASAIVLAIMKPRSNRGQSARTATSLSSGATGLMAAALRCECEDEEASRAAAVALVHALVELSVHARDDAP